MVGAGGDAPYASTGYEGALIYCATMYKLLQESAVDAREYHEWAMASQDFGYVVNLLQHRGARAEFVSMLHRNFGGLDQNEYAEVQMIASICGRVLTHMATHVEQLI